MCDNLPRQFMAEIGKEILGKSLEIEMILIAFLARGHVLIEDLPGMGKTSLAKIISQVFQLKFRRIQGSADLLPNDILGVNIFNAKTREFELREGPVFSEILLFDEMNRTPPRTQSALLQVMAEQSVTIDQSTYVLKNPFFVLGTQNPSNSEGTYRLPDSQMDRFSLRLSLGYPDYEFEKRILMRQKLKQTTNSFSREEIIQLQNRVEEVHVDEKIVDYILSLVHRTRLDRRTIHGVSVRGSQELHRLCKARAVCQNRDYVIPEDVKVLAPYALSHRILSHQFEERLAQENYISELLDSIPIPL
tara:strand:- start:204 stop:1115 length:912 start_codon:yes stop_codon:yes gene_type:complete